MTGTLKIVASWECAGGHCPTIYATDNGNLIIQGYTPDGAAIAVPPGECLVEVPRDLLIDWAREVLHVNGSLP